MKKVLMIMAALTAMSVMARDFTYKYNGQTLAYTVIDEDAKTCMTKAGSGNTPGNLVSGTLFIPEIAMDGSKKYTVTALGDASFQDCDNLNSVVLPATITSVGKDPFYECDNLVKSAYPSTLENPFNGRLAIAYDPQVSIIENDIIYGRDKKVLYFVPVNFKGAFEIPASVNEIERYAFMYCKDISAIEVGNDNVEFCSEGGVLFNKAKTSLIQFPAVKGGEYRIPESVESIGAVSFFGCDNLTSVTIPASVTKLGSRAFANCKRLTDIKVDSDNAKFCSIDGVLFYKDLSVLIQYPGGRRGEYTIPDKVASIGYDAFSYNENLTNVIIPNSVSEIGEHAFDRCLGLETIAIPNSVTAIGKYTFFLCSSLKSIDIPETVKSIGQSAFARCKSLRSIYLPNDLTTIGISAFSRCSSLTTVHLPDALTSISDYTFYGCSSLSSINIPNGVTSIGRAAFYDCSALSSIDLPNSVLSLGMNSFNRCRNLATVELGKNLETIGEAAFYYCESLKTIEIPASIVTIDQGAFARCTALTSVYYSAEEPIEGNSNIFNQDTYKTAVLYLTANAINKAKSIDPWRNFSLIKSHEFSGIEEVLSEINHELPFEVYTLGGVKVGYSLDSLTPGVYVIRQGRTAKKISL